MLRMERDNVGRPPPAPAPPPQWTKCSSSFFFASFAPNEQWTDIWSPHLTKLICPTTTRKKIKERRAGGITTTRRDMAVLCSLSLLFLFLLWYVHSQDMEKGKAMWVAQREKMGGGVNGLSEVSEDGECSQKTKKKRVCVIPRISLRPVMQMTVAVWGRELYLIGRATTRAHLHSVCSWMDKKNMQMQRKFMLWEETKNKDTHFHACFVFPSRFGPVQRHHCLWPPPNDYRRDQLVSLWAKVNALAVRIRRKLFVLLFCCSANFIPVYPT